MLKLTAVALLATSFTQYPALTERGREGAIEAFTDKGLIYEIIVRCPRGTGIMSYSKVEGVYCTPRHGCTASRRDAIRQTCN